MEPISLPRESGPRPTSDKLIIVVAPNKIAKDQLNITQEGFERYAKKCVADFFIIEDDLFPSWPMANKWRILSFAKQYSRVLYLDVDIVINLAARNIFTEYPENKWWVYDESEFIPQNHKLGYWITHEESCASQALFAPGWCANGGVLLFPGHNIAPYEPPRKEWPDAWCFDQSLLTARLVQSHSYGLLNSSWNWGYIRDDWWSYLPYADFIHCNGARPEDFRLELLRRISQQNYEQYPPACEHRQNNFCNIASKLAQLPVKPHPSNCYTCKTGYKHTVNPITCELARAEQIFQGLDPDPTLQYLAQNHELSPQIKG